MMANFAVSRTGFFRLVMRNFFDSKSSYADFHCYGPIE